MKKNAGGALLFAIITAFVLSLIAASMVSLMSNQYRFVSAEVNRITAQYRLQAAVEYAIYARRIGHTFPANPYDPGFGILNGILIDIAEDASGISELTIRVTDTYNPY